MQSKGSRRGAALGATVAILAGFSASNAYATKNINFDTTGSVRSTLAFNNQVVPDVYEFFASAGETIVLATSATTIDTTIRVVGPDASISLFNDDNGTNLLSRLTFTAADTGAYIVIVSSFSGNPVSISAAEYTLTLARGAQAARAATLDLDADAESGQSNAEAFNPSEDKP
jgi:hypothetical protein